MSIRFFSDGVNFQLKDKRKTSQWLKWIAAEEGKEIGSLVYIFVSDEIILKINKTFLQHDYYTDIITFDDTTDNTISGEMYVSIDIIKSNSKDYHVEFRNELLRVIVHGVLHLCGYNDKTESEQQEMRDTETRYLSWWKLAD